MQIKSSSLSDKYLIYFIPITALICTLVTISNKDFFQIILQANVILLGYHHVIATFTRISFSKEDYKSNKFITWPLLLIVMLIVFAILIFIGSWAIATIYFYWQWFHYTRQSYGIAKKYERNDISQEKNSRKYKFHYYTLYLLPLTGILYRSSQQPDWFLSLKLYTFPIPNIAWLTCLVITFIFIAIQLGLWINDLKNKCLNESFMMYMVSHHIIFTLGYMIIPNIDYGWLCINIWHNAQYLMFVWVLNSKRFNKGVHKNYNFISKISQKNNRSGYFIYCLGITVAIYWVLIRVGRFLNDYTSFSTVILIFMGINFHHYIVDSIIWKNTFIKKLHKITYPKIDE